MKTIKLLVVLCLLSLTTASAQNETGKFTIKPVIGLNISTLRHNMGQDPRYGFVAGAEVDYRASHLISLSLGALYSQQGNKQTAIYNYYAENHFDYINFPLLANVYLVKGLALKAGVQPGFLIHEWVHVEDDGRAMSGDPSYCHNFSFSIPVGLSYEFSNLVLDARYNWGLTKVTKVKGSQLKYSVFQFTMGYKFKL